MDLPQMDFDVRNTGLEQLRHLRLSEPEGIVVEPAFNPGSTVLRFVEKQAGIRRYFAVTHPANPPIIARIRSVTCFNSASITANGLGGSNT